jgi:hypothetical protein
MNTMTNEPKAQPQPLAPAVLDDDAVIRLLLRELGYPPVAPNDDPADRWWAQASLRNLPNGAWRIGQLLAHVFCDKGTLEGSASVNEIRSLTCYRRNETVREALKQLAALGLLDIVHRIDERGRMLPNLYRLRWGAPQ